MGVLELEGKTADAVRMLEGLVQKYPNAADPKERLARLYLAAGDLKRAEATAAALLRLPETASARLAMSALERSCGRASRASGSGVRAGSRRKGSATC